MKKQIKELFVQDLAKVQGGTQGDKKPHQAANPCPEFTTLACNEEMKPCDPPECP